MARIAATDGGARAMPFILPYGGVMPAFRGAIAAAPGAAVLGRAEVGIGLELGARATIRADGHEVRAGRRFRLGAHGTVHIAHELHPAIIGDDVSAGAGAVIHACEIGDGCVLGPGAIVLDGSRVGPGAVIAEGALVVPRSELEGGWLHAGAPARPVRRLAPGEAAAMAAGWAAGEAVEGTGEGGAAPGGLLFAAATASFAGRVVAGERVGVWFGCHLDGRGGGITIGAGTNIQDNSVIRSQGAAVEIGRDVTIGHNVTLTDASVGDGALVGIGAMVAPGTRIGPDVLLAAGASTEPGQALESGWLWGGRPARRMKRVDADRRAMMATTCRRYEDYGAAFAAAQARG